MEMINIEQKILLNILKNKKIQPTAGNLAKTLGVTRSGIWKALNKLLEPKYIMKVQTGTQKNSLTLLKINYGNQAARKFLEYLITQESQSFERWYNTFKLIYPYTDFTILFGSTVQNPKKANDIDILNVAEAKNFRKIAKVLHDIKLAAHKHIHDQNMTPQELKKELSLPNYAYQDALARGIVLSGQEKFVRFMEGLG